MLDDYKDSQPISYEIFKNSLQNKRNMHAYLIETNGNSMGFDFTLSFVKSLLCPYNYLSKSKCVNCTQCNLIEKGIFLDLKIIESSTNTIKKEQIDDLQKEFTTIPISKYKIYIIKDAEKMTLSASNSMLKFLEDPEENIIGILLTQDKNQILSTLVSRCQVISMKKKNVNIINNIEKIAELCGLDENKKKDFISNNDEIEKYNDLCDFVKLMETDYKVALANQTKTYNNFFQDKMRISLFFNELVIIYQIKLDENPEKYRKKLEIVLKYREMANENYNSNLLLDRFIIDMR